MTDAEKLQKYENACKMIDDMYFDTKKAYVNACKDNKNKGLISFLQDKMEIIQEMEKVLK